MTASRLRVLPIDGLDDRRVAVYRSLRRVATLRRDRTFVAEGARVVRQLLESSLRVRSLLLDEQWLETLRPLLDARPEESIDAYVTTKPELERIVGFHVHQGVMAVAEAPVPPDLLTFASENPNHVLVSMSAVANAENVGGILRNMAGLGAIGLIIDPKTNDPFVRRAARVSMGAVFRIPVWRTQDLAATMRKLREHCGTRTIAAHVRDDRVPLGAADLSGPILVALGSENDGLPDDVVEAADQIVEIPMAGGWSCLNVSTAGAILLYEIARRRAAD